MNSETIGPKLLYHEPVEGEERDAIVARGLKIVSSGVAPWPGPPCSDHNPLHGNLETGELFMTLNINGASLSNKGGRSLDGSTVTPELLTAFKKVWSEVAAEFFAPLAGTIPEHRLKTALGFWRGPTVFELNVYARFVSPFLQGSNDLHELVSALSKKLESGSTAIEAAVSVAKLVNLTGANWKSIHALPIDAETGLRLDNANKQQQLVNLTMYFYYLAVVAVECPDGFKHAIETAPPKPTAAAIIEYLKSTLVTEDPHVLALQEVPATLVDMINHECSKFGYAVHSAPPAREAGVVTIVKKSGAGSFFKGTCTPLPPDMAHRSLETGVILEDGTRIMVVNIHGDSNSDLTEKVTRGLNAWYPSDPAVVLGDFQIGKIDGGHSRVVADLASYLEVSVDDLSTTPPLLTRTVPTTPNVFCCQFKFKNL